MKRALRASLELAASRALTPVVIGFFFLLYTGIAFSTDETLVTLMEVTRGSKILICLLALIPLNSLCRLAHEAGGYLRRRRALGGATSEAKPELFDETVTTAAAPLFGELEGRLGTLGYRMVRTEQSLAACRGWNSFPSRALFLAGTFCLFSGILISLTARDSQRAAVIEGEALPASAGAPGKVERIVLSKSPGPLLDRTLTMEVVSAPGEGKQVFGLYPPALFGGAFVYPRYLGVAPLIRFSAPDLPRVREAFGVLNIYPAGKEDRMDIPDSPYHLTVSMTELEPGKESYMTGHMSFQFKLLKGKDVLFSGSEPLGGEFARDGYRLAFVDYRRMVFTDFIRDYGVLLVWAAALLFCTAGVCWLPVRLFFPRREMLFVREVDLVRANSRAEGGSRRHSGVFHEALDLLDARRSSIE